MAYGTIKADKITYDDGGSDADANVSDIVAKASLASPAFTGTPTAPTAAADTNTTQLATTAYVQTELGDYAPLASPTFTGTVTSANIAIDGQYTQVAEALGALAIDCGTGNYFTKTIDGDSTFTVSNVPASKSYSFVLELTHTSGTITWFSGVEWPASTAPTLTTGKTHLFVFHTDNGGTRWRASSLVDYTN